MTSYVSAFPSRRWLPQSKMFCIGSLPIRRRVLKLSLAIRCEASTSVVTGMPSSLYTALSAAHAESSGASTSDELPAFTFVVLKFTVLPPAMTTRCVAGVMVTSDTAPASAPDLALAQAVESIRAAVAQRTRIRVTADLQGLDVTIPCASRGVLGNWSRRSVNVQ